MFTYSTGGQQSNRVELPPASATVVPVATAVEAHVVSPVDEVPPGYYPNQPGSASYDPTYHPYNSRVTPALSASAPPLPAGTTGTFGPNGIFYPTSFPSVPAPGTTGTFGADGRFYADTSNNSNNNNHNLGRTKQEPTYTQYDRRGGGGRGQGQDEVQPTKVIDEQPAEYVNEGPVNREGPFGFLDIFVWPQVSSGQMQALLFSLLVNLGVICVLLWVFVTMVLFDDKGNRKPFKGACFETSDMDNNICFFSAGQFAYGIIAFGQLNVGLVSIGQCSVGLLFAFGQLAAGLGFSPLGQVAVGWYIWGCQMGIASYKIKYCQGGLQFLCCFVKGNEGERAFKSCH